MIRAYGDKDHCKKIWDLRPERRRRKARAAKRINRAHKISCSTQFANYKPLENGEMHVAVGEGVSARRVRISFRGAHLTPSRQQYYTVRSLTLAARCLCHGHAQRCAVDNKGAKCECLHATCGSHCHRCCSGGSWAPHKICDETLECLCGERGQCSFDDTGATLCLNCTENRGGPSCDKCLFGYYNTASDGPCVLCDCDPEGSDGSCEWDNKRHRVSCNCLPGFAGHLCDFCESSNAVFPLCHDIPTEPPCKCDVRGIVDPTRECDEVCECKLNVIGERCDTCAPGHFGLSSDLREGCRPCYCSHVTDICELAAPDPNTPHDIVLPLGEAWMISDSIANETLEPSLDEQGKPFVISYEVEGWENFYWLSRSFNGEQFDSYGGEIRASLFWGVVRGDSGGNPTVGPDVMLISADGRMLAYANATHETPGQLELSVPLIEGSWYVVGDDEPCSRLQLMDALRDLRTLMIKAHFHMDQDEIRLENAEIRAPVTPVSEVCSCPAGYTGVQCSSCAWSHARILHAAGAVPPFECVPCACNEHASCDTVEGPCGSCQHNTTGAHCERCLPGHYGNPVQGACKPCACPLYLPSNNFSPNCALASAEGDEFVCTQCPDGYTGDHCENCDFGYWGSPTTPGGSCQECACGGSPCHPTTGLCLTCPPHTEGARCDLCQEGYWFGAGGWQGAGSACVECACGAGALSAACDARSGLCACRQGWAGRACDSCARGHGGLSAGCPVCRCGIAARNNICDPVSGGCLCAPGAAPPSCDNCLDEHYGLDVSGCQGCNCSSIGAEGNSCDIRTGQCRCKSHVTGRACDVCDEGYWGLDRGGCRRCECGSGASSCDPVTGVCACATGVGGVQCDRCLPGYYGFGPAGCLLCPVCSEGKVCSPTSGRCVCPGGSLGPGCKQCARGYWATSPGHCRPCACGQGALNNNCNPQSGQCKCRPGWAGLVCDVCAFGHHGPKCKPCDCNLAGSKGCSSDLCPCDNRGRCNCKENVVGEKCEKCLEGTFGLAAENPVGCTACFCFGRAAQCSQAELARAAVHAASPLHIELQRSKDNTAITTMDQDSLLAIHTHSPEATISLPWPPAPVYVELDKRFLGDRVTSYGGLIKFRIEQEGGVELDPEVKAKFPLVRIYGKNIVLDHYEHVPPLNGSYSIRLHESLWWVRGHNAQSSRAALMLALQRVDRILLRVTTRAPSYDERVHALLLNVSLDTAIPGLSRSAPALGVEICACPRGYSASSCQEPDIGFWMPPPRVHLSTVKGTIVISLEGEAQPCHCHNRATKCDPETGYCLNCTAGTGGPRCSICAAGFYGNPNAPAGCQPCPCPSRGKNFASGCNVAMGRVQCLCKPGYSGPRCESCAVGYRRDATGGCARCTCGRGAVSRWCDAHDTCRCRDYATGPTCDTCLAPRTYMDTDGCMPCDNCTQTLLDSIEEASSNLRKNANPAELKRIPKPFPALKEFARNTTMLKTTYDSLKKYLENVSGLDNSIANLEATEHRLFTEANRLKSEASRRLAEGDYLSLESVSALEDVLQLRRRLGELVEDLDEFAKEEKHLSAHRALKEARQLLKEIRNVQLTDFTASVNDVFDMANLQTTSLKEYKYRIDDTYKRVKKLGEALTEWEKKAADLHHLGQAVWDAGDQLVQLQEKVKPRLAAVRDIGLRCRLILEDINSLSTNNLTDAIGAILLQSQTLAIKFPSIDAELKVLTLAAEEKEGILYSLTPAYRQKYLEPVEKHVKQLAEKAIEYKNLFAGSRAAASLGVSAAQAWSRVASLVQEASEAAEEATRAAAAASSLARGSEPMLQLAGKGKNSSEDLKMRGAAVLARAEALGVELEGLAHATDATSVTVRGAAWRVRSLGARPEARVLPVLEAASAAADRLFLTTRALYDEASDVRRLIRYHIRKQLAELQRHGDTALGAAQEHVSQIRGNTARGAEVADALAAAAAARARQHRRADRTLRPALAALRDNIERARHAADSISVSLTSSPGAPAGCSRAFPTDGASGAVTQIAIDVSFDNTVRDGPLIHLVGEIQNDVETYMKLVVEKQRLKLTWNLGGDEGLILHPQLLQSTHDDADHTSYRIDIERIWNVVELRLEQAGGAVTSARNSSARGAALRVRGLWAGDAAGGGLPACVHALRSAGRPLGLWRGVGQPKDAACTGCTHRWMSSGRGDSMTWFDGAGYVELRRSRLRPVDRRQFSIAFTFQTRDENALLFMATDIANNRSVTIVMRECRVYFIVEYTGSRLELVAPGRHCDGRPAHLQAIRAFAANNLEKGSLRVNGEERLGSPSPPVHLPAALPDLSAATYAVGGLPPGPAAPAPPLRGCLGALSIDREGYDLLDTPTRHGVEPNCGARTIRSAIFEGSGHIELPSPVFRRKAALGISFRARAPDGLILFRAPSNLSANEVDEDGDGHFIVLALIKGELEVIASAGKSELVLRTNGTRFDDGMLHSVQIIRIHKQVIDNKTDLPGWEILLFKSNAMVRPDTFHSQRFSPGCYPHSRG
ncbi:laminin subunit alpha-2 [Bombyx mandarina]|uniref:Laminin subunit alpha-2 n=1 Tax=Bombyx mandarina TaxID=7092 RepID=A0A6J2J7Q9_BOMMA|nr:laminin subunit alpha-2 [Bombyx mandarina]